jgi:hypothetical protein
VTCRNVVAQAAEEFLVRGRRKPSAQVSDGVVEGQYVFGRHPATAVSVAYAILVAQWRARIRAAQEGRPARDERGDLGHGCPRPGRRIR